MAVSDGAFSDQFDWAKVRDTIVGTLFVLACVDIYEIRLIRHQA